MRMLVKGLFLSSALLIGASGLMAQSDSWREQWFKTKFGHYSPMEEARQRAEAANTVYREQPTTEALSPANTWREQWFKAKFGHYSPTEEARERAEGK